MANTIILNAFYDAGDKAGTFMAWATTLLLTAAMGYAMFKYVLAKNKD